MGEGIKKRCKGGSQRRERSRDIRPLAAHIIYFVNPCCAELQDPWLLCNTPVTLVE